MPARKVVLGGVCVKRISMCLWSALPGRLRSRGRDARVPVRLSPAYGDQPAGACTEPLFGSFCLGWDRAKGVDFI